MNKLRRETDILDVERNGLVIAQHERIPVHVIETIFTRIGSRVRRILVG